MKRVITIQDEFIANKNKYAGTIWNSQPQWDCTLSDFTPPEEFAGQLCYLKLHNIQIDSAQTTLSSRYNRVPFTISTTLPQISSYSSIFPKMAVVTGQTPYGSRLNTVLAITSVNMPATDCVPCPIRMPQGPTEVTFSVTINSPGPAAAYDTDIPPGNALYVALVFSIEKVE